MRIARMGSDQLQNTGMLYTKLYKIQKVTFLFSLKLNIGMPHSPWYSGHSYVFNSYYKPLNDKLLYYCLTIDYY